MIRVHKLLNAVNQHKIKTFDIQIFYQGRKQDVLIESVGSGFHFPLFKIQLPDLPFFHLTMNQETSEWNSLEFEPIPDTLIFIIGNEIESHYLLEANS